MSQYRYGSTSDHHLPTDYTLPLPDQIPSEKWRKFLGHLLELPTRGQIAALIVVAVVQALNETFNPGWEIDYQPIHAPDSPARQLGDITVKVSGQPIRVYEVTQRLIDSHRVRETFDTKVRETKLREYVFLGTPTQDSSARSEALVCSQEGADISIEELEAWCFAHLSSLGIHGRKRFAEILKSLLESELSDQVKHQINDVIRRQFGD